MIEKQTIIDQIEITRSGHIQVRLGLLLIEDGREISRRWHRTSIEPGGDVDATIAAVNADITTRDELRAMPIQPDSIPQLKAICKIVHTPNTVKTFRERAAAAAADLAA